MCLKECVSQCVWATSWPRLLQGSKSPSSKVNPGRHTHPSGSAGLQGSGWWHQRTCHLPAQHPMCPKATPDWVPWLPESTGNLWIIIAFRSEGLRIFFFFSLSLFIKHKHGCWINVWTRCYLNAALLWAQFWCLTWLFGGIWRAVTKRCFWYDPAACRAAYWSLLPGHSTDSRQETEQSREITKKKKKFFI